MKHPLRTYFMTGLVILLPLTLTVVIVAFIFNLLTGPFVGMGSHLLSHWGVFEGGWWIFTGPELQELISRMIILALLVVLTILLGMLARWFIISYFIWLGDLLLHRIPFFNSIYKVIQDVTHTIFKSEASSFKQVVLIPFPKEECYSVGLVTKEVVEGIPGGERVAVFVPTTPNPTSGFMVMVKKEEIIPLDMSIEEALRYVISCGVVGATFRHAPDKEKT